MGAGRTSTSSNGKSQTKAVNAETRRILRTMQNTFITESRLMASKGDTQSQRALQYIASRVGDIVRGGYEIALEQLAEAEAKLEKHMSQQN